MRGTKLITNIVLSASMFLIALISLNFLSFPLLILATVCCCYPSNDGSCSDCETFGGNSCPDSAVCKSYSGPCSGGTTTTTTTTTVTTTTTTTLPTTTQPPTTTTLPNCKTNPWSGASACCSSASACVDYDGNCVNSGSWGKGDGLPLDYCENGNWYHGFCFGINQTCMQTWGCKYTLNTIGCAAHYPDLCVPAIQGAVVALDTCQFSPSPPACSKNEDCPNGQCCDTFAATPKCVGKGTITSSGGKSYLCDPPEGFVEFKDKGKDPTKSLSFLDMIINFLSHFFKK